MPIQQNTALFSLLGTLYGGNGTTTFQLPNLGGRAVCSQGQSPGLTPRVVGEDFGRATETLTQTQIPAHSHALQFFQQRDTSKLRSEPNANAVLNVPVQAASRFFAQGTTGASLSPVAIQPSGGGQPHENRQPYLALNFCIALRGVFPAFP